MIALLLVAGSLADGPRYDLPRAILACRRGLSADPADERFRAALDAARAQVRPADAEVARRIAPPADLWPPWLALGRLGAVAFAAYALGCVALTRWRATRRRPWLIAGLFLFAGAVVPAAGSFVQWQERRRDAATPVVVVARAVELRAGNGVEYPAKLPLPRGAEVRRQFARGDWLQVEIADGTVGWLPANAVVGNE